MVIPNNVASIGNAAFSNCKNLVSVEVGWNLPTDVSIMNNLFLDVDLSAAILTVPFGTKPLYEAADVWKNFGTIVEKQSITVDVPEPAGADGTGKIDLSLNIPTDAAFTGSFSLSLPNGLNLDVNASKLAGDLGLNLELHITQNADGSWLFTISTKPLRSAKEINPYRKIVEIIYTVDEAVADGNYEALISDVDIDLDNGAKIVEESIVVKVTVDHSYTGISGINSETQVYVANHTLYINSAAIETVNIYSVAGTLLYSKEKGVGTVVIPLNTQERILIVKGSSGWAKKVTKN
jgi:hypothetical protein